MNKNISINDISDLIKNCMDALQRHSITLILFLFLFIYSSYNNFLFKVFNLDVQSKDMYFITSIIMLYGSWNLFRLTKKLRTLIEIKMTIGLTPKERLSILSHHWIFSPFNSFNKIKIRFRDSLPILIFILTGSQLTKFSVRYFNNEIGLLVEKNSLAFHVITSLVWSPGLISFVFLMFFLKEVLDIYSIFNSFSKLYIITNLVMIITISLLADSDLSYYIELIKPFFISH